jgi:hypothetical protein
LAVAKAGHRWVHARNPINSKPAGQARLVGSRWRLSNFTNATEISYHDSVRLFEAAGHEHFGESSDYAARRPNLMSETSSKSYTGGESVRPELTAL